MLVLPAPQFPSAAAQAPFDVEPRSDIHQRRLPCRSFRGPHTMRCGLEFDEWIMARALVRPTDTVVEFGARYGTTSCALAAATNNSGRLLAVEPDPEALPYLLANRLRRAWSQPYCNSTCEMLAACWRLLKGI